MSTDVQWEGGFSGKKRERMIHRRLFSLMSGFGEGVDDEDVFEWLTDDIGWQNLTTSEEYIFAALAKALPGAGFNYETSFDYEGGGLDQMYHTIEYTNGKLNLSTLHRFETFVEEDEDNEDEKANGWDDDYQCHVGEDLTELSCMIDKSGLIVGDDGLSKECLKSEIEQLSELLELIEKGTDDPADLVNLGILYETGLAGIDVDLTLAWSYYLKAAETGDEDAVEFVKEIFDDENKEELHKILMNKCISRELFNRFFELALEDHKVELTAELLEYKAALE